MVKIRKNVDYTTRDYDSFRADMITRLQQKIPEYTDTSSTDFGIVLIELLAHGLDILSYYNDRVAKEMFLDTATERDSVVSIATNILGYEVQENTPAQFYQVFEIQPRDYVTRIPRGTIVKTVTDDEDIEEVVKFETLDDVYIPAGCTGLEKDVEGEYLYKVLVEQGESRYSELLGTSTGEPNQEFYVPSAGVIRDSIEVYVVDESGVPVKWERVPNFISSGISDKHYMVKMLDEDVAVIKFGNGNSGKIPYTQDDGITVNYRIGGGSKGNVKPHTIVDFEDRLAGYVSTFNPYYPHIFGVDKETIEEIIVNAPASLKTMWGAITEEDYADLVRDHRLLQDVTSYSDKDNPLNVHVTLLPHGYLEIADESKTQIRNEIAEILLQKKALGVSVTVDWAKIKEVDLAINITLDKTVPQYAIEETLRQLYEDLYDISQRKLGEGMYISDFVQQALELEGIRNAYGSLVYEGIGYPEVLCEKTEVLTLGTIVIKASGGE